MSRSIAKSVQAVTCVIATHLGEGKVHRTTFNERRTVYTRRDNTRYVRVRGKEYDVNMANDYYMRWEDVQP